MWIFLCHYHSQVRISPWHIPKNFDTSGWQPEGVTRDWRGSCWRAAVEKLNDRRGVNGSRRVWMRPKCIRVNFLSLLKLLQKPHPQCVSRQIWKKWKLNSIRVPELNWCYRVQTSAGYYANDSIPSTDIFQKLLLRATMRYAIITTQMS